VFGGVGINRLLRSAVYSEVCLLIAGEISLLILTEPATGSLKIAVWTVIPFQTTSRGVPTFTETIFMGALRFPEDLEDRRARHRLRLR